LVEKGSRLLPSHAKPGCWVYFIRQGLVAARAKVQGFVHRKKITQSLRTYSGQRARPAEWNVKCSSMHMPKTRVLHRSFQGFQYVTAEEAKTFRRAFDGPLNPVKPLTSQVFFEGAIRGMLRDTNKRAPAARDLCIMHYGCACVICGIEFECVYGSIAAGFIHVHHMRPFADRKGERRTDPVKHLRPVCPNCHAVLHLGSFSIPELKKKVESRRRRGRVMKD
jgi:predicted HNH restriction endonuclease